MKGLFITLEGPDGSGKSTMIDLISKELRQRGIDPVVTREPGGTPIGEKIRDLILDPENRLMSPETEALLYAASRGQHVHEKIRPALGQGRLVLCDRFLLSSLAYQGVGRDLGVERVKMINDFALQDIYPDLILFFHVDPEVTLRRKTKVKGGDRLEREGSSFHKKVYEGYMDLMKAYPKNLVPINANRGIDQVLGDVLVEIDKKLKGD